MTIRQTDKAALAALAAATKLYRLYKSLWLSAEADLKEIDRLLNESDHNIDVVHQIARDARREPPDA